MTHGDHRLFRVEFVCPINVGSVWLLPQTTAVMNEEVNGCSVYVGPAMSGTIPRMDPASKISSRKWMEAWMHPWMDGL